MSFDLNDRIAKLLIDEPFFAALSRNLPKRQDDSIPTACISVDLETGRYEMLYNNAFFSGLTETQQRGVLKHEFYHVVFEHVTRRRPADTSPDAQKLWNHATDLAINSHLKGELPEGVLMPGEGVYKDLPLGESADWYLAHMPKAGSNNESGGGDGGGDGGDEQQGQQNKGDENKDDQGKGNGSGDEGEEDNKDSQGNGSGDGGGHDGWGGEGNSEAEQMARQRLKEDVKKAAQEAATKGDGEGGEDNDESSEAGRRAQGNHGVYDHSGGWREGLRQNFPGRVQKARWQLREAQGRPHPREGWHQ